jgi:hypothetical protein
MFAIGRKWMGEIHDTVHPLHFNSNVEDVDLAPWLACDSWWVMRSCHWGLDVEVIAHQQSRCAHSSLRHGAPIKLPFRSRPPPHVFHKVAPMSPSPPKVTPMPATAHIVALAVTSKPGQTDNPPWSLTGSFTSSPQCRSHHP